MFVPRFLRFLFTPFQIFVLPTEGGSPGMAPTSSSTSAQAIYESASPEARALFDSLKAQLDEARATVDQTPVLKTKAPKLPDPRNFDGSRNTRALSDYLHDVKQHFKVDPRKYPTEELKIIFAASFLKNTARTWYQTLDDSPTGPPWSTFEEFQENLDANFAEIDPLEHWLVKWDVLQQKSSVSVYLSEFTAVASHLDLTDQIKIHHFKRGLKDEVLNQLALLPQPSDFDGLVKLANQIDGRLFAQRRSKPSTQATSIQIKPKMSFKSTAVNIPVHVKPVATGPVPMQLDASQRRGPLTEAEKQRRRDNNLCLYCGGSGHMATTCPVKTSRNSGN
ncbi:hypothetical protein A4X09_0g7552 [Tilletia walkeri]|uniref:CCHC-type domain-containing protein n=1 Tax=Tilletia walkeri TaxID=117179 RepID=A0A8X7N1P7_9BASI|nr:hypothetical protein A4X09_0g7552 [Tilletia walkeri]